MLLICKEELHTKPNTILNQLSMDEPQASARNPGPWNGEVWWPPYMYVQVALQEFTCYFKGLKETVISLYDTLVESYSTRPEPSHTRMKKILLNGFLLLRNPTSKNTE